MLGLVLNTNTEIDHNTFTSDSVIRQTGEVDTVSDAAGTNDYIHDNNLDGGATSLAFTSPGKDDGLIPSSQNSIPSSGERVQHNTFSHFYDIAIEMYGTVTGGTFTNNTVSYTHATVGGYFGPCNFTNNIYNPNIEGPVVVNPSPYDAGTGCTS